jgi:hypothetical protein
VVITSGCSQILLIGLRLSCDDTLRVVEHLSGVLPLAFLHGLLLNTLLRGILVFLRLGSFLSEPVCLGNVEGLVHLLV